MKCLQIIIRGKVQGVWFRVSTRNKAQEFGVCGIVKNQADGAVYVEVEGDESTLKDFVAWCYEGSEYSRVDTVDILEIEKKAFVDFQIVRST